MVNILSQLLDELSGSHYFKDNKIVTQKHMLWELVGIYVVMWGMNSKPPVFSLICMLVTVPLFHMC